MRLFVAVETGPAGRELVRIQGAIKELCPRAGMTRPDNLHMTVKFIGEAPVSAIQDISKALDEAAKACKPFKLRLDKTGIFTPGMEGLVWCGCAGDIPAFETLCRAINAKLLEQGYPPEIKKTLAHITLARRADTRGVLEKLQAIKVNPIEFSVSKIVLMESARDNGALTYISMAHYELRVLGGTRGT